MSKIDLRKLEWGPVEDWSTITFSQRTISGDRLIGLKDVKGFFDRVIRDIARKADMPFNEVKKAVYEENKSCKAYIVKMFSEYAYSLETDCMNQLKKIFLVPKVTYSAKNFAEMYKLLSDEEKENFRKLIG